MKASHVALVLSVMASPVLAEAPGKPLPPFSDAPPPPLIAPAPVAACCTDTGRFSWTSPSNDKPPVEGAACEAKTADGLKPGNVCY